LKQIKNYAILFGVAGLVIALDQWTKSLVRNNLPLGGTWLPWGWNWLAPYARIINWHNSGAAFGSFQGYSWVFTILAFLVAGLIIYYYSQVQAEDWWLKLTMGMQLGGALGNVVDRLLFEGRVTDFISVGNFPVFNVADASITMGVVILIAGVWIKELQEAKKKSPAEAVPGAEEPNQELAESEEKTEAGSGE
jgi:signal peptidase II